jgi:hypothetical protein
MKPSLFIGVTSILILFSFVWILATARIAQPALYIEILITILIIANIIFSIEEGWGLGPFLASLFFTALAILFVGTLNEWINASISYNEIGLFTPSVWVNGIRWISLIWPFAVLIIGISNYCEKILKEKVKQEEPVKEIPKAE